MACPWWDSPPGCRAGAVAAGAPRCPGSAAGPEAAVEGGPGEWVGSAEVCPCAERQVRPAGHRNGKYCLTKAAQPEKINRREVGAEGRVLGGFYLFLQGIISEDVEISPHLLRRLEEITATTCTPARH